MSESASSTGQVPSGRISKPVKACRVCKIGKNKCEVEREGLPCKRCEANGVQCIRDPPKKRRNRALESTIPLPKGDSDVNTSTEDTNFVPPVELSNLLAHTGITAGTEGPAVVHGTFPVHTEDRVTRLEQALEGLGSKLEQYMSAFSRTTGPRDRTPSNPGQLLQGVGHPDLNADAPHNNLSQQSQNHQYTGLASLSPPQQGSYSGNLPYSSFDNAPLFSTGANVGYQQEEPPSRPIASTSQLAANRSRSPGRVDYPQQKRARLEEPEGAAGINLNFQADHGGSHFGTSSSRMAAQNHEDSRDSSDQEPPGWPEKAAWKPGGVHTEMYGVLPYSTPGSEASSRDQSRSPIESVALPQSNLHRPFDALADAVAAVELMEQQQRLGLSDVGGNPCIPGESPIEGDGATPTGSTSTENSDKRRKKAAGIRRRGITRSTATILPSVVAQDMISLHEAWRLFDFYKRSCHPFVPVLSEVYDTFDVIQRESMLFNSILAVSATRNKDLLDTKKDKTGPNVRSRIVGEVSNNVHISLHRPASGRSAVQALITFAAWHHYPFSLTGHALRMAVELRLYLAMEKLLNPATRHPDESEEELYASARIWLAIVWLDFQISTGTGRLIIYSDQIKPGFLDLYHTHRLAECTDTVLASNIELMFLKRRAFEDANAVSKAQYDEWLQKWDSHLARFGSADSFQRQYILYQHAYAIVESLVPKLRHGTMKNSSSPGQKAYQANVLDPLFQATRSCMIICLSKWTLYHALPYMPRHTLVQISYVALLALQLAYATRRYLLDPEKVLEDSRAIADLVGKVHLGARFASTIRKAGDRFQQLRQATSPKSGAAIPQAELSALQTQYDSRLFVPPSATGQQEGIGQMWPFDFSLGGGMNEGSGSWLATTGMDWTSQFLANPSNTGTSASSADEHIAGLDALLFDFGGGSGQTTYNSNWAATLPFGSME